MSGPSEADIKECFDQFDADGSGFIDAKEIENVCKALGVPVDGDAVNQLIADADADGDKKISYKEFKNAILG